MTSNVNHSQGKVQTGFGGKKVLRKVRPKGEEKMSPKVESKKQTMETEVTNKEPLSPSALNNNREVNEETFISKLDIGPYAVMNNKIYKNKFNKKTNEWELEEVGRLVYIKDIQQDIETKEVSLVIEYYYHGKPHIKTISRKQLQRMELIKLLEFGVDCPDYKVHDVQQFLNLQEQYANYVYTHKHLGWSTIDDKEVFKHGEIIGDEGNPSTYNGSFKVQPKGSFENWKQVIEHDVIPYPTMALALTAGFTSPLVAWLAKDLDLEVILFHAYADSTKGKTTAARVFTSPFGLPATGDGCILKWNGTKNGIIAQLVHNHGVPLAIDEASMNNMKDFTDIIYTLAEGKEKVRMTKELSLRERRNWSGVLWSTAEHGLFSKTNKNTGLQVRLFEFKNVTWTESADHANRIKEGLLANYGHAGPMFVKYLLDLGKEEVIQRWNVMKKQCMEAMSLKDQYSQRIADKYALLLVTANLVNECFNFGIDVEGIQRLLVEVDQDSAGQRSNGDIAYHSFLELVIQNKSKFETRGQIERNFDYWGRLSKSSSGDTEVSILTSVFKKEMQDRKFSGVDVILKHWKEKGYLDHDPQKLTRKRAGLDRESNKRSLFYCVKVPNDLFEADEKRKAIERPTGVNKPPRLVTKNDLFKNK